MSPIYILKSVSKIYDSGSNQVTALQNINCNITEGSFVSIVGKSGCGKSTLLNLLGGLDQPSHGEIIYRNNNISTYTSQKLANYRKEQIGIIFQSFNLINSLSSWENIAIALAIGEILR